MILFTLVGESLAAARSGRIIAAIGRSRNLFIQRSLPQEGSVCCAADYLNSAATLLNPNRVILPRCRHVSHMPPGDMPPSAFAWSIPILAGGNGPLTDHQATETVSRSRPGA
jgi:hypothetical protein